MCTPKRSKSIILLLRFWQQMYPWGAGWKLDCKQRLWNPGRILDSLESLGRGMDHRHSEASQTSLVTCTLQMSSHSEQTIIWSTGEKVKIPLQEPLILCLKLLVRHELQIISLTKSLVHLLNFSGLVRFNCVKSAMFSSCPSVLVWLSPLQV